MAMAEPTRQRGRKATSSLLRLLAALVALLLTASALGQAAHFLLVPHAICAEHGELLELSEGEGHVAGEHETGAENARDTHASAPEAVATHEHCEVLARGQREQALPGTPVAALLPAVPPARVVSFSEQLAPAPSVSCLALAPKTSPPRALEC
jgi:hypothetical protein